MKSLLLTVVAFLLVTASAFAGGVAVAPPVNVPVFTPWASVGTAAVLGLGGLFTLLRRK